jgi:hypothetical protein
MTRDQTYAAAPADAMPAPAPLRQLWPDRLTRAVDLTLDGVVVLLATWTVVYHVCLILGLRVPWAVGLEITLLVLVAVARHRTRRWREVRVSAPVPAYADTGTRTVDGVLTEPRLVGVTVAAIAVSAAAMATDAPWTFVWVSWLVGASSGTVWAWRRLRDNGWRADPDSEQDDVALPHVWHPRSGRTAGVVSALLWAVGLAVLSTCMLRPNPDDLYYVNLSQWVVEHGDFPTRDTIFSDQVFPMSSWPPVASYDALVGVVARLTGTAAASVAYVAVLPLATVLSVLALWRLLRAWRIGPVALALSAALIFLLFDGAEEYSTPGGLLLAGYATPGGLFLTRLWQGKVILLCVLVPLLLVYGLRYVERPTWRRLVWVFVAGTAAVGLSTSAIFLVPLVAVACAAPLVRVAPRAALAGFAAMAAYPLGAGVVTKALGGRSADNFGERKLYRFAPHWFGHEIFQSGIVAVIGVTAVLLGALLVTHRQARLTTGLLALVTGLTFLPGVTHLAYDVIGLGPTLWRVSWVASIAALVGVLATHVARLLRARWARWGAGVASVGLLLAFGVPTWSGVTNTSWEAPFHWQRDASTMALADKIIDGSREGALVLAPDDLAITIDITTTKVKTAAPRDYVMDYLRDDPAFHYDERLVLVDLVNEVGPWHAAAVIHALRVLDVDVACVYADDGRRYRTIVDAGYTPWVESSAYRCVRR